MDNLKITKRFNIKDIVIGEKKLEIPFELFLSNNEPPLQCSKLLRFTGVQQIVVVGEHTIAELVRLQPRPQTLDRI